MTHQPRSTHMTRYAIAALTVVTAGLAAPATVEACVVYDTPIRPCASTTVATTTTAPTTSSAPPTTTTAPTSAAPTTAPDTTHAPATTEATTTAPTTATSTLPDEPVVDVAPPPVPTDVAQAGPVQTLPETGGAVTWAWLGAWLALVGSVLAAAGRRRT